MNIKTMSVEQLKAMAYDILVIVEQGQNNLRAINAEIALRNEKEPAQPVVSKKEK